MADIDAPQEELTDNEPPQRTPQAPSMAGRLKLFGFLLLVVGAECAIAYVFLPDSQPVAAESAPIDGQELLRSLHDSEPENELVSTTEQVEIDLYGYGVTSYQPASGTTLRIDFHLWGLAAKEDKEVIDKELVLFENRIRAQVVEIIRASEITDLGAPELGLIRRKVLERINRIFGKPYLQEVMFVDFSWTEQ